MSRSPTSIEIAAARVAAAVAHGENPAPIDFTDLDPAADFGQLNPGAIRKAQSQGIDPFSEVGTTGLRQFGGYVLEEWLAQLAGRKAAWVWREMLDNDPIVGSIMFAIKMLARTIDWPVQEGNDAQAAEFVETALHDMEFSWSDTINEILSFLPYGWALEEVVHKRRQGPQPDPPWNVTEDGSYTQEDNSYRASSDFTDGKIGWRKFSVRAQETLLRWGFDGYSGIRYMEQIDWHGGDHKVPLTKGLLFRTQKDRNNPEGRSILRNAFTSYWALKNLKQIEAIGVERDLAGVPVMTPPEGVNLFSAGNAALLGKVQKMVTGLRRDEYEGIVLPSAGWDLKLLSAAGSRQFDTDKVVRRYRQDIALSMLADFVLIGQDSVGSYAMVDVKSDLFGTALDGIFDLICEQMNQYAIPRLLKLNGMDTSDPPQLAHGSARKMDLERVGAFLQAISLAGAPIPWSMELLRALFTDAGLPPNFKDYEAAEGLPGQQPDPKDDLLAQPAAQARAAAAAPKPASASAQPASATAQTKPKPKKSAKSGKSKVKKANPKKPAAAGRSGMVSLDLTPGTIPGVEDPHITIVFLGRDVDDDTLDAVHKRAAKVAARMTPPSGTVGGLGTFPPSESSDGKTPAFAIPVVDGIDKLRSAFEPFNASEHTDYRPHVTLAYVDDGDPMPPPVDETPVAFTHLSVHRGDEIRRFPFRGVSKAERTRVPEGTTINVQPALSVRARVLSDQLDQEIQAALGELAEHAATAYQTVVVKAGSGYLARLVARVMRSLNLQAWIQDRLLPILRNHAGRVAADTQRTLQAEVGLEMGVAEDAMQNISDSAGQHLGMRDIEPQVRASIMEAIRQGLAAGDSPTKTAQRIRDRVPAGRFVHAGSRYRAQLISREETANAMRAAMLASYRSNPHITHLELRDGIYGPPRSDAQCMARDGEVVPISDPPAPYHPLCTLSFSPVVSGVVPDAPPVLATA